MCANGITRMCHSTRRPTHNHPTTFPTTFLSTSLVHMYTQRSFGLVEVASLATIRLCMPLVLAPNNSGRSHTFEPVVVVRVRVQTEKVQILNIWCWQTAETCDV